MKKGIRSVAAEATRYWSQVVSYRGLARAVPLFFSSDLNISLHPLWLSPSPTYLLVQGTMFKRNIKTCFDREVEGSLD